MKIRSLIKFEKRINIFRVVAILIVLTVVAVSAGKMIRRPFAHGDFGVYLNAAKLLLNYQNIYTTPTHPVEAGGLFYIYPPLFAFLMTPLTLISDNFAIVFWCILSVFLLAWTVKTFYEFLSEDQFFNLSVKDRWIFGFFSILLTARFILHHFDRGQTNILIMALMISGIAVIFGKHRSAILGGFIIGFSAVIKPVTLPVTIYFVLQKKIKVLVGIAAGLLTGIILPAVYLGFGNNFSLLKYWFENYLLNSSGRQSHLGLSYNFSPLAQLYRFFTPVAAFEHKGQQYSMMIFQLPNETIFMIDWLIRFLVVFVIFLYWLKFREHSKIIRNGMIALIFATIPLLFPTAQKNYFVFLLPSYIYVIYLWHCLELKGRWFRGLVIGSFLLASATTDGIWGKMIGDFLAAAGFMIWGTILLIAAILVGSNALRNMDAAEFETANSAGAV